MLKLFMISLTVALAFAVFPGDKEEVDVNSPDVQTIARFAVTSQNAQPSRHDVQLVHILKAERQIVSGINYFLDLEVTEHGGNKTQLCKVTVFDQPWTHTREVTEFICQTKHTRQMPIGAEFHPIDTGSSQVQGAAQAAVQGINNRIDIMYAYRLSRVISAEEIFNKYRLEIAMEQSNCRNVPTIDPTKCTALENGLKQTCTVTVNVQLGMNPVYVLDNEYQCH